MKIKWVFYASLLLTVGMNGYAQRNAWGLQLGSHYMLEGGVRIRSEPNLQGSIIGRLEPYNKVIMTLSAETIADSYEIDALGNIHFLERIEIDSYY